MACRREGQNDDSVISITRERDKMNVDHAEKMNARMNGQIEKLKTFIDRGFEEEMNCWGKNNASLNPAEEKMVVEEARNEELYAWDKYVCSRAFVETNPTWDRTTIEALRVLEFLESKAKRYVSEQKIGLTVDKRFAHLSPHQVTTPITLTIELLSALERIVNNSARLEPTRYKYGLEVENGLDEKDRSVLNGTDGVAALFCIMQTPRQPGVDPKTFKVAITVKQSASQVSITKGKRGQSRVVDEAEEEFAGLENQIMDYSQFQNVQIEEDAFDTLLETSNWTVGSSSSTVHVSAPAIISGNDNSEQQVLSDQQYVSRLNDPSWMEPSAEADIEMGQNGNGVNAKATRYRFQRKS